MADAVNAGFARSEQLKKEWGTLRDEIAALDPDRRDSADRRAAIQLRMNQITKDMADVLTQTRKHIPTPDIDDEDDNPPERTHRAGGANDAGSAKPSFIQYSARNMHIIQRTYDSSDDDDDVGMAVVASDDRHPQHKADKRQEEPDQRQASEYMDADQLRQQMMLNATSTDTVVTVEGRPQHDKGTKPGWGGLSHMIMDKLRLADLHSPTSPQTPLTEEEREKLTLEQSRLERETRKLKRIPERSRQEQRRLDELAARITKISKRLDKAAASEGGSSNGNASRDVSEASLALNQPGPSEQKDNATGRKGRKSAFFGSSGQAKGDKHHTGQSVSKAGEGSPTGNQDESMSFTVDEEDSPLSNKASPSSKPTPSKRKKGWMVLEAGVASIKALRRNMLNSAEKPQAAAETGDTGKPPLGGTPKAHTPSKAAGSGGNAFAETAEKLAQRGEKLNTAVDGSEQMAEGAGDMLDAVRALRQRNQKGGFFS